MAALTNRTLSVLVISMRIENTFGFLTHDVARLMGKRFDQLAGSLGLSRAQAKAIAYLIRNEGINQAGLAELLDVEPISLTRLLDRMEAAGWIERRPHPADRRARCVYVTDKVRPVFARIREIAAQVRAQALAGLSDKEAAQLTALMERVHANLSDRECPAQEAACLCSHGEEEAGPSARPSRRPRPPRRSDS